MAYAMTIAGVSRPIKTGSLRLDLAANSPDAAIVETWSPDGSYVPGQRERLVITESGSNIFAGIIEKVRRMGPGGMPVSGIVSRVEAKSFKSFADGLRVTHTFASGTTLKAALEWLETNVLTDKGFSLDAGQATGFTFTEDMVYDGAKLSDVFNEFALIGYDLTGNSWIWDMDADDEFRMTEGGTVAGPEDMVSGTNTIGDVTAESSSPQYANRVTVKFGPAGVVAITKAFTGNGTQTVFQLDFPVMTGTVHPFSWQGVVWNAGTAETLGITGSGATWIYDPVAYTITRTSAPANGNAIEINYDAQFPQSVFAEDSSYATDPVELSPVPYYPNITSKGHAQALADALLAQHLATINEVRWRTRVVGYRPGQSIDVTVTEKGISTAKYLITSVRGDPMGSRPELWFVVDAIQGSVFRGSFRDGYRSWNLRGGGAGASTSTGPAITTGSGGASPGSPLHSVQFNNPLGTFAGDSKFLWKGTATYSGFPANLRVEVEDESRYNLVLVGPNGTDHWRAQVIGGADITWDGGRDWNCNPSRDMNFSVGREFIVDIGDNLADAIKLNGIVSGKGFAGQCVRTAASTFTIDTTVATAILALICDTTSNAITVNLPALTSAGANPSTAQHRVLMIRNDGAAANAVTVTPNGSDAGGFTLADGESAIIIGLTGTGAGWKRMA